MNDRHVVLNMWIKKYIYIKIKVDLYSYIKMTQRHRFEIRCRENKCRSKENPPYASLEQNLEDCDCLVGRQTVGSTELGRHPAGHEGLDGGHSGLKVEELVGSWLLALVETAKISCKTQDHFSLCTTS